ncbi:hypothetical protein AT239_02050 [Bartonella henselae]|nr:hypothetical protein AT239_02050 [Bartonella henselae]OLL55304.1 hypothetical protein AT240_07320 [Bartonella henselae]
MKIFLYSLGVKKVSGNLFSESYRGIQGGGDFHCYFGENKRVFLASGVVINFFGLSWVLRLSV